MQPLKSGDGELIDGYSLERAVGESGVLQGAALAQLAVGTAGGLAALHAAGEMHGSLNPGNILVGLDGPVITGSNAPNADDPSQASYVSPEQITGTDTGPAADIFAWAGCMVFAATGRPAFGAMTVPLLQRQITEAPADLGALDGHLRELAASCLSKHPQQRPTAATLLQALTANAPAAPPALPDPVQPLPAAWLEAAAGSLPPSFPEATPDPAVIDASLVTGAEVEVISPPETAEPNMLSAPVQATPGDAEASDAAPPQGLALGTANQLGQAAAPEDSPSRPSAEMTMLDAPLPGRGPAPGGAEALQPNPWAVSRPGAEMTLLDASVQGAPAGPVGPPGAEMTVLDASVLQMGGAPPMHAPAGFGNSQGPQPGPFAGPLLSGPPPQRNKRRPVLVGAAVAVALVVAGGAAFGLVQVKGDDTDPLTLMSPRAVEPTVSSAPTVAPTPTQEQPKDVKALTSYSPKAKPNKKSKKKPKKAPKSLLVNGGFEKGVAPWTLWSSTLEKRGAHSGRNAMLLQAGNGRDAGVEFTVSGLKPNTEYTLTGWVKSPTGQTFIGAKNFGGGDKYVLTKESKGYVRLFAPFTTGANATTATVLCWRLDPGAGACDDLALYPSAALN